MVDQIQDSVLSQEIFNASVQGILVVDQQGFIIKTNRALDSLFGYGAGELTQTKVETLIPALLRNKHEDLRIKYSQHPETRPMGMGLDLWGVKKDGAKVPLDISLSHTKVDGKVLVIAFISDDTPRRTSMRQMKIGEERLAEAQKIAHIGSWSWNTKTNERYWSDEFYRICGLQPGDPYLTADSVVNFIHPDDRERSLKIVLDAMENHPSFSYEKRILRHDGSIRHVLAKGTVRKDDKGESTMIQGTLQDITEIREVSLALKREKKMLHKYLDTAASIFLVIDKNHKITMINQKGCELLGVLREEVVGTSWFDNYIPKKERKTLISFFDEMLNEKITPPDVFENLVLNKSGRKIWIQWHNAVLRDDQGGPVALLSSGIDVTVQKIAGRKLKIIERKNKRDVENYTQRLEAKVMARTQEVTSAIQKLEETNLNLLNQVRETQAAENKALTSQALFAAIASNFPRGVIIVYNSEMELVYIEGEELLRMGFDKSTLEGKSIDKLPLFNEEQKDKIKKDIQRTLDGKHLSFELEFHENSYAVNSTPLYAGADITWALFVYSNITVQKQVEKELSRALKIEQELNDLKSRFISMASHEFRTPLSVILSSAILIGKQNGPGNEEKREKHVSRIRTNVKNLVVILNDFLSLDKLEEGNVKVKPQYFDLVPFSAALVDELEISKKEGQILVLKNRETSIDVRLDPKLVNHIIINLLSNAIKYTDENKEILFELAKGGDKVIITITDQGIGIPEMEQKKLFERFFRAENAANIQGTGLGLHIVKQYTELMGGAVQFKSQVGVGSVFTIELPINYSENEKSTFN